MRARHRSRRRVLVRGGGGGPAGARARWSGDVRGIVGDLSCVLAGSSLPVVMAVVLADCGGLGPGPADLRRTITVSCQLGNGFLGSAFLLAAQGSGQGSPM